MMECYGETRKRSEEEDNTDKKVQRRKVVEMLLSFQGRKHKWKRSFVGRKMEY